MIAYVEDLKRHVGQEVTLRGWLYHKRVKGKIAFLLLRDGSGIVQCVAVKAELGDEAFAVCDRLPRLTVDPISDDTKGGHVAGDCLVDDRLCPGRAELRPSRASSRMATSGPSGASATE